MTTPRRQRRSTAGQTGRLGPDGHADSRGHENRRPGTPGTRIYAEREFREGCQILVATEAAGEGIDLQFCWFMITIDTPWNPVRFEQRVGRIHQYGQDKVCLIFNFVAQNTREQVQAHVERAIQTRNEAGSRYPPQHEGGGGFRRDRRDRSVSSAVRQAASGRLGDGWCC